MPGRLKNEEIERIKEQLISRKRELWGEILIDLEKEAGEEYQDLVQLVRDKGDEASDELKESTVFSLIELKHKEVQKIDEALQRIERDAYGRCMDCGEAISPARLAALPFAVRCRNCQEKLERIESI